MHVNHSLRHSGQLFAHGRKHANKISVGRLRSSCFSDSQLTYTVQLFSCKFPTTLLYRCTYVAVKSHHTHTFIWTHHANTLKLHGYPYINAAWDFTWNVKYAHIEQYARSRISNLFPELVNLAGQIEPVPRTGSKPVFHLSLSLGLTSTPVPGYHFLSQNCHLLKETKPHGQP